MFCNKWKAMFKRSQNTEQNTTSGVQEVSTPRVSRRRMDPEKRRQIKECMAKFSFFLAKAVVAMFCAFWAAAIVYSLIYYTYMPKVSFGVPAYLQYDPACATGAKCAFPISDFDLTHERTGEDYFRIGQTYDIVVELEMPNSVRNQEASVFMAKTTLQSAKGHTVFTGYRNAALPYKSELLRTLETIAFLPFYLFGNMQETQTVRIPMGAYEPSNSAPAIAGKLELKSTSIEVYSVQFKAHAQFAGVRYCLFYYPICCSVIAVGLLFGFFMLFVVVGSASTASSRRMAARRQAVAASTPAEEASPSSEPESLGETQDLPEAPATEEAQTPEEDKPQESERHQSVASEDDYALVQES